MHIHLNVHATQTADFSWNKRKDQNYLTVILKSWNIAVTRIGYYVLVLMNLNVVPVATI